MLLLHHTGARSGKQYVNPLAYQADDGRYVVFASKAGAPVHPGWYYNLKANPEIKAEVGTQTLTVRAEELDDTARARLWPALVAEAPSLGEFQARATRQIPVFMLTRQD